MNTKFLRSLAGEIGNEASRYTDQTGTEMRNGHQSAAQCSATAARVLSALAYAINMAIYEADKEPA